MVLQDILPETVSEPQRVIIDRILSGFNDHLPEDTTYRSRRPRPALDIDGLGDLVMRIIEEQQNGEDVSTSNRVQLVYDFPPGDIQTELITYGLKSRIPGSFSRGPAFNAKHQEVKPHVRDIEDDPQRPGYKVVTLGQMFENEVVLTCWAKTNKQANRRARWLEDALRNWTWYIRYMGIDNFYFTGQEEDIVLQLDSTSNVLYGRPLHYYVKTERLSHVLEPTIRRIIVKYGLGQVDNTTEL